MAQTVHPDIQLWIGNEPVAARRSRAAIDSSRPYVEWSLPPGMIQRRWNIRIASDGPEPRGWAYRTSGTRQNSSTCWQVPPGVPLNSEYLGLCQVQLAVSEVDEGEMEWLSESVPFVYDPNLQRFTSPRQIVLSWTAPVGGALNYRVQIANEPSFADPLYDQTHVGQHLHRMRLAIDRRELFPDGYDVGEPYFWRVYADDGLDAGPWSATDAFACYTSPPTGVQIVAITPLGGPHGDVRIDLAADPAEITAGAIEISYTHDQLEGSRPCRLMAPTHHIPPEVVSVIWRLDRCEPPAVLKGLTLYARVHDGQRWGAAAWYGPVALDLRATDPVGGGIGMIDMHYPIAGRTGSMSTHLYPLAPLPIAGRVAEPPVVTDDRNPIAGALSPGRRDWQGDAPVRGGEILIPDHHVVGRHLSSLDNKLGNNSLSRQFPPSTPVVHQDLSLQPHAQITRQVEDGGAIAGAMRSVTVTAGDTADHTAIVGRLAAKDDHAVERHPVHSRLAPGTQRFWTAGWDVNAHPGHGMRLQPTQMGGFRVRGAIGDYYVADPLRFRFSGIAWDAYQTLHWSQTGSETSLLQLQYRRLFEGGGRTPWADVPADNARFDATAGEWLIDPLIFHAYWDTYDRTDYPNGGTFQLRMRQSDPIRGVLSDWIVSGTFTIGDEHANPTTTLATHYNPWGQTLSVRYRIDGSHGVSHDLVGFWYSRDDGQTWQRISRGDILGQLHDLKPGEYVLVWQMSGYDPRPGNRYRIKIEGVRTGAARQSPPAHFRWSCPVNPGATEAEYELVRLQGSLVRRRYDPAAEQWVTYPRPVWTPGRLGSIEREMDLVRRHPQPDGMFAHLSESPEGDLHVPVWDEVTETTIWKQYAISDPSGYQDWLEGPYDPQRSHGEALAAISREIEQITQVQIPSAKAIIRQAERACRRDLMDQGFFAEAVFPDDGDGHVEETISVRPIFAADGDEDRTVDRHWRFRVSSLAAGPEPTDPNYVHAIYDGDGEYDPEDLTSLETVAYEFQLDGEPTFDSQGGRPLRDLLRHANGERITVAMQMPAPGNDSGLELDVTPSGASLVLATDQLPGYADGDTPTGDGWVGEYYWRVAAYNAFLAPTTAEPRLRIEQSWLDLETLWVQFVPRAHTQLTGMDLVSRCWVSDGEIEPAWSGLGAVEYVSDRRASDGSDTEGLSQPWVPAGVDRRHPVILFDDDRMQYLSFHSKRDDRGRWRVFGARGMTPTMLSEYEVYFGDSAWEAIYAPAVIRHDGQWWMFMTAITTVGQVPRIAVATSPDGHQWGIPQLTDLPSGALPSVQVVNGQFHLWREVVDGIAQVHHAVSDDGLNWTDQGDIFADGIATSSPAALSALGQWWLAVDRGGAIRLATSEDGTAWTWQEATIEPIQVQRGEATILLSPAFPSLFLDLAGGNDEIHIAFTYREPDSSGRTWMGMLERRHWLDTGVGRVFNADGGQPAYTCGDQTATAWVDVSELGLIGPPAAVRLWPASWRPAETEYRRRSAWASPASGASTDYAFEPWPWAFTATTALIPYRQE